MTEVSAGIVRDGEGRILVCRRGEGRRNAHLWEFPGGKREPGEDAAACLRRELEEELRLPITAVRPVWEAEEGGIRFTFLTAETAALPVLTEHEDARFAVKQDARERYAVSLPAGEASSAFADYRVETVRKFGYKFIESNDARRLLDLLARCVGAVERDVVG